MGFVIIVVGALYLLISIGVVVWAVSYAKKAGKSAKKWGWGAALVMWLIPFWDWLPTVAVHQYYCATESGFWVYKTPEQWKQENPGVKLTLAGRYNSTQKVDGGFIQVQRLNQRFDWVVKRHYRAPLLRIDQDEELLIDRDKKEVLQRYVDFSMGYGNPMTHGSSGHGLNAFKFWLNRETCSQPSENRINFENQINKLYEFAKGEEK